MENQHQDLYERPHQEYSKAKDPKNTFSVLQWNTLASLLCDEKSFPYADPKYLAWDFRKDLHTKEFARFKGDIICLEEVDRPEEFKKIIGEGYSFRYNLKPDNSNGLLLAFSDAKFESVWQSTKQYFPFEGRPCNQVYHMNLLRQKSVENSYVLIIFTHLKAGEPSEKTRVHQAELLTADIRNSLQEFKKWFKDAKIGVIFTGDLNSEPDWETLKKVEELGYPSVYKDTKYTTLKIRDKEKCRTIDYMFYHNLTLLSRAEIPTRESVHKNGFPSDKMPSDHYSLFAIFEQS